jgi:two-component system phosphate regulon response regulator PhoB
MKKTHILIVEDESDIQQLVSYNLIRAGFNVSCADSGEEALECLRREKIDCILLDLMLPGMNGLEVCSAIKKGKEQIGKGVPIIMLTAKGEEEDIVAGLENGADDYVTKPFSPKVLIARIKSVLRRIEKQAKNTEPSDKERIVIDDLEIDQGRHEIHLAGELLQLTMTEFGILTLLAKKPGWVFTRQQIIDSIRGYDFLVTPRAIDVQVFGLRKKLGKSGQMIETVRGIGYRFKSEVKADE